MVTLYGAVGVNDVSNRIKRIDVWRKATEGIGQATLLLHNQDKALNGLFSYKDDIIITVNNADYYKGYAEKNIPTSSHRAEAAYEKEVLLNSLDYGKDLANRVCDKLYKKQRADAIFNDMLTSSEITFPDYPLGTPPPDLQYEEGVDLYLVEAFRRMLELINYDGFVNTQKQWKMFAIGSIDSGVTLKCVAGAADNNIIGPIKRIEFDGLELYIYVFVRGRKLDDGWTEGNPNTWTGETGNTVSDEFTIVKVGVSSIKFTKDAGSSISAYLTFPLHNFDYLDFSNKGSSEMSIWMYQSMEPPYTTIENPIITLWDTASPTPKSISYTFSGDRLHLKWHQLTVPMGTECTIHDGGEDCWVGDTDFNWKISKIKIYGGAHVDFMCLDGLSLPFRMLAVAQDTGTYGTRMFPLSNDSITSQFELDQLAQSTLEKRKEVLSMLEVSVYGTSGITGSPATYKFLPGYKVTVNSPDDGLDNAPYRIFASHEVITENAQDGHDFIVQLTLVPVDLKLDTQRMAYNEKPEIAFIRSLHDRLRFLELESVRERDWWPPLPKDLPADRIWENRGTAFPASPVDLQRFFRTDLKVWFRYSEGAGMWVPAGGAGSTWLSFLSHGVKKGGIFESLDNYTQDLYLAGSSIAALPGRLKLTAGPHTSAHAAIYPDENTTPLSKYPKIRIEWEVDSTSNVLCYATIGFATVAETHFGFRLYDGYIWTRWRGTSEHNGALQSYSVNTRYVCEAYYMGDKILFYVNGVLKETATTDIPSPSTTVKREPFLYCEALSDAQRICTIYGWNTATEDY